MQVIALDSTRKQDEIIPARVQVQLELTMKESVHSGDGRFELSCDGSHDGQPACRSTIRDAEKISLSKVTFEHEFGLSADEGRLEHGLRFEIRDSRALELYEALDVPPTDLTPASGTWRLPKFRKVHYPEPQTKIACEAFQNLAPGPENTPMIGPRQGRCVLTILSDVGIRAGNTLTSPVRTSLPAQRHGQFSLTEARLPAGFEFLDDSSGTRLICDAEQCRLDLVITR